jgi:hypothetical protein
MMALLLLAAAAVAQAAPAPKIGPVEHLKKRVVEAVRNCAEPLPGEVVVCAPDRGIAEGYRVPKLDPRFARGGLRPNGRGEIDEAVAATGTGSCSNVGAGGATGCARRDYDTWAAERRRKRTEDRSILDPQ